jgi:hypothetical protein
VSPNNCDGALDIYAFFSSEYDVPFFCLADMSKNPSAVREDRQITIFQPVV